MKFMELFEKNYDSEDLSNMLAQFDDLDDKDWDNNFEIKSRKRKQNGDDWFTQPWEGDYVDEIKYAIVDTKVLLKKYIKEIKEVRKFMKEYSISEKDLMSNTASVIATKANVYDKLKYIQDIQNMFQRKGGIDSIVPTTQKRIKELEKTLQLRIKKAKEYANGNS